MFQFSAPPKCFNTTHLPLESVGFLDAKVVVTEWTLASGFSADWHIVVTCGGGLKGWGDWIYKKLGAGNAPSVEAAHQQAEAAFSQLLETKPLGFWLDIALGASKI